jgi:hypothetical protein
MIPHIIVFNVISCFLFPTWVISEKGVNVWRAVFAASVAMGSHALMRRLPAHKFRPRRIYVKDTQNGTPAVIVANSKDAKQLHQSKTEQGKEASKVNAVQHGVRPLKRGSEPVNPGISESPRSAVADPEKNSPRREPTVMAESQMATSSNGESINTKHPSSPPNSRGPVKTAETEGALGISASRAAELARTFGTSNQYLCFELLAQVTRASPKEPHDREGMYVVAALNGIGPRDTIEGMLATQMVAVHNLAMRLVAKAVLSEQPFKLVEGSLNLATKLLRTYAAQVEALDRHRGKGEQKMNVEQVHIHAGAQDIVGPVSHQNSFDTSAENHGKSNGKSNGHRAAASKGMVEEWESAR